ncbi:MAG: hypothetical protein HY473_02235 [Candidatus Sungbacteria bacterium]|uniref:PilN domain-containing protein n=1 Tax=Candidatus Sungiibacteriota bacterium TaxID=2750080 RepID=A0A932YZ69_9BACT|nr:hypothetical protein [Candidatus Sungbacteria bacterium]
MLNLNLLPPQEKINLAYEMKARALRAVSMWLVGIFIIFAVLLLPTIFLLGFQKREVGRSVELELRSQERSGVAGELKAIQEINRLASVVAKHANTRELLFPVFEDIVRDIPSAIRLQAMRFRSSSQEMTLEGYAPTRASLLELLRALEMDPRIGKVSSPVANLIPESNITFSVVATVKRAPAVQP